MQKIFTCLLVLMIFLSACKKGTQLPNSTSSNTTGNNAPVVLPDSVIVTSGISANNGTTSTDIQLINAANGSVVATYTFPNDPKASAISMQPFIGNNFLYEVDNNKINALNITTGAILWTDSVKNFAPLPSLPALVATTTILHNDTFYALYLTNSTTDTYVLCAIDATKQSTTPLWKYTFTVSDVVPAVTYYNGAVYLSTPYSNFSGAPAKITAFDAKAGTLKWTISNNTNFSLASINYGFITVGNTVLDAASGNQVAAVTGLILPPVTSKQTTTVALATTSIFFTTTNITGHTPTYVSTLNSNSQALKWTTALDSSLIADQSYFLSLGQVWNNQLITETQGVASFSGAGSSYGYSYAALDINTGQQLWTFNANGQSSYAIVNNILYTYGDSYGSGYYQLVGATVPPILSAVDMRTGKAKWNNTNMVGVNFCMYAGGKGYSPSIQ